MPQILPVLRVIVLAFIMLATPGFFSPAKTANPAQSLENPPELRAKDHTLSLTLHAAITSDGKDSFYFNDEPSAPTLRLSPGDQLKINYVNDLPAKPLERCLIGPCIDRKSVV